MQKKSEIFRCSVKCWESVFQNLGIFKDRFNDSNCKRSELSEVLDLRFINRKSCVFGVRSGGARVYLLNECVPTLIDLYYFVALCLLSWSFVKVPKHKHKLLIFTGWAMSVCDLPVYQPERSRSRPALRSKVGAFP